MLGTADASEPIPWQHAGDHVGRRVVVEGVVAATRSIDAGCVLAFTDAEPLTFTVTLLTPLFTRGPARPEEHYRGKRVRVTGVVRQLPGHSPEIIVRNPGEITVVEPADLVEPDLAEPELAEPAAAAGEDPAAAPAIPRSATRTEEPARPPVSRPTNGGNESDTPSADAATRQPATADCTGARARWHNVRTRIETVLDSLSACVRSERYRCRPETEAVYAAMAELATVEGAIEASCP